MRQARRRRRHAPFDRHRCRRRQQLALGGDDGRHAELAQPRHLDRPQRPHLPGALEPLFLALCISSCELTLLLATQAFYCQKTQSNTVDTFKSPEQGFIGTLLSTKPLYYSTAAQPTFKRVYDLSNVTSLPPVEVLIGYQGGDLSLMDTAVENGAKGIIIAGVGSGSVSETGKAHVAKAVEKGVPVVRSTKINVGASRAALPCLESTFSNRRTDPFLPLTLASSSPHRLQRPRARIR